MSEISAEGDNTNEEKPLTKEELFADIDYSKNKTMDQSSIDELLASFLKQ